LPELALRSVEPRSADRNQEAAGGSDYPTDSSKVVLQDPEVAGDTLFGRPQSPSNDSLGERTGIPLAGIHSIATHQSDPTKTTLLLVGIGVVTFGALCAADAFGCGPEENTIAFAIGPP